MPGNVKAAFPFLDPRKSSFGVGVWTAGAVLTNPTDTTLIVDTGALTAGDYLTAIIGAGSVAWVYDIQHRNAANDDNIKTQRRRFTAAGNEDLLLPNKITLADSERVRCILVGNITGELQMSIFILEVS